MAKKINVREYHIGDLTADECAQAFSINELKIILYCEPDVSSTYIMLDNMELDFVSGEYYEYAAVVYSDKVRRQSIKNNKMLNVSK